MKSTGIVRKMDELGRIVIPIELRRTLNISEKESLEIYTESDKIILRKHISSSSCIFCGSKNAIHEFKGRCICPKCLQDLQKN